MTADTKGQERISFALKRGFVLLLVGPVVLVIAEFLIRNEWLFHEDVTAVYLGVALALLRMRKDTGGFFQGYFPIAFPFGLALLGAFFLMMGIPPYPFFNPGQFLMAYALFLDFQHLDKRQRWYHPDMDEKDRRYLHNAIQVTWPCLLVIGGLFTIFDSPVTRSLFLGLAAWVAYFGFAQDWAVERAPESEKGLVLSRYGIFPFLIPNFWGKRTSTALEVALLIAVFALVLFQSAIFQSLTASVPHQSQTGRAPTPTRSVLTAIATHKPSPTPSLAPSPTPTPKTITYTISVSATQDIPGVNTNIRLHAGQHIHITASGSATYGVDSFGYDDCSNNVTPTTYPDGTRLINGTPCPPIPKQNGLTCPNTSIGMLCANFGQGWFYIGMSYDGFAPIDNTLYFIYSDGQGYYDDNSGAYQVIVTVG